MDDYLKLRLSKLSEEEKQETLDYLLDVTEEMVEKRRKEVNFELMAEHTDRAEEYYKNFGKMQGLSSGYQKIDALTKGFVDGELIVIAGKTSYGKTTLAINISNKVALNGTPVLFITLEMTKPEITSRFMSINGGNNEKFAKVSSSTVFQTTNQLNWTSIRPMLSKFRKDFGHGLVIIDHLHYFTRELSNVAEDLGRITKELKGAAEENELPVILISHVRKTSKEESAGLDDLRGSSYIAQDADIVLLVGRDNNDDSRLFVVIEKNRNRGFKYKENEAELYLDKITIHNAQPVDIFPTKE